jgi:hypothetical protein
MCFASAAHPWLPAPSSELPAVRVFAAAGSSKGNSSHTEASAAQSNAADPVPGTAYAIADATTALSRADAALSVDGAMWSCAPSTMRLEPAVVPEAASIRAGVPAARSNARTSRPVEAAGHPSAVAIRVEALPNSSEVFALQVECAHHDIAAIMIGLGANAIPSPDLQIQAAGKTNASIRARMAALRGRHRDFGDRFDSVLGRFVPVPGT